MIGIAALCLCLSMGFQNGVGSPITAYELSLKAGSGLRLHIVPATWSDAALICQLEGGVLGSPTSVSIARDMFTAMDDHNIGSGGVFIGKNDPLSPPFERFNLGDVSQPDNADGTEVCVALTHAGALAVLSCSRKLPFFCHNSETQSTSNINLVAATEEAIVKPFDDNDEVLYGDEYSKDDVIDTISSSTDAPQYNYNAVDVFNEDTTNVGNPSSISPQPYYYKTTSNINLVAATEEAIVKPFDDDDEVLYGDDYSKDDVMDTISSSTDAPQYNYNAVDVSNEDTSNVGNPSSISPQYYYYEGDYSSSDAVHEYDNYETTLKELTQCSNNEYEYDFSTGSCYKFHLSAKPWLKALATCHAEGGYLAIINSDTESEVLKRLYYRITDGMVTDCEGLCNPNYASIGFRRWDDDEFATINGKELTEAGFDKWSPGEPNNYRGREDCGSIYWDGLLNDTPCLVSFPFICESDS